jgi:flagellar protein FlgJ
MLNVMGVGREPEAFGGGFGAEAFRSFLHEAYASALVRGGGIGIADALYRQVKGDPRHG